jgi:hypothetical protein
MAEAEMAAGVIDQFGQSRCEALAGAARVDVDALARRNIDM